MLKIIKNGTAIGIATVPNYIKLFDNGCYGLCSEEEAQGLAYDGQPYNLEGREPMPNLETVTLEETQEITISNEYVAMTDVLTELGVLPLEDEVIVDDIS